MQRPSSVFGLVRALWRVRALGRKASVSPVSSFFTKTRTITLALGVATVVGFVAEIDFLTTDPIPAYTNRVEEIMAAPDRFVGERLRVEGEVCGPIDHAGAPSCVHRFAMTTPRGRLVMPVLLNACVLPDMVQDDGGFELGVVVEGELQRDGAFLANQVVARSPSKYVPREQRPLRHACPRSP